MKTVLFALLDQWADWEAAYLASALRMLGQNAFICQTVSVTPAPVRSIGGLLAVPDFDLQTAPSDYQALILVGGMSWREETARQLAPLVHQCLGGGKLLGAICDAAGFLGTLGVLNTVRHTANDLGDLKAWAGAAYTGEPNFLPQQAVSDGGIVTANGTAALEFAREVLLALQVAPEPKITEWYDFHKKGYYGAPLPQDATSWEEVV